MKSYEKRKEKWLKTRAKGRFRFVLKIVLFWGIFAIISSPLIEHFSEYFFEDVPNFQKVWENIFPKTLIRFIIGSLTGFIIARLSWTKKEQQFSMNLKEK